MSLSVLPAFALTQADELVTALRSVVQQAPFRHMLTPGGFTMSVASTNCGSTASGFSGFEPDACLINRYVPASRCVSLTFRKSS
jgi:alkylated DNA repair protein (DNA oxidative demethylase)